ncbi:thioredoxin-interacting protein-like, partial [Trematomus bernacchii]|uniref:thioredoxin-interacting protein-like n=1 Tax=Trematomus bernacchii TaxID=40690 RepID=UPI00146F0DDD
MVLMKPLVLRVELPERLYSGGEKLSGSVLLEAEQPLSVAGLRVTVSGRARVEHRGGAGGGRRRREEEEYLRREEVLRLEEQLTTDSDGCFLLQPQKLYRFCFGFELPAAGLVSSYKGKFGSVRYCVRAELDRPSQNALRCEREFEVEEPLDVNQR